MNITRAQRSIWAHLRSGILPLAVETGRLHPAPEEDAKCHMCDLDEVENEMHFTFCCPFDHDL